MVVLIHALLCLSSAQFIIWGDAKLSNLGKENGNKNVHKSDFVAWQNVTSGTNVTCYFLRDVCHMFLFSLLYWFKVSEYTSFSYVLHNQRIFFHCVVLFRHLWQSWRGLWLFLNHLLQHSEVEVCSWIIKVTLTQNTTLNSVFIWNSSPAKLNEFGSHFLIQYIHVHCHLHSTFCNNGAPYRHTPPTMFHIQHYAATVKVLPRTMPNMTDPICSKLIHFGFVQPKMCCQYSSGFFSCSLAKFILAVLRGWLHAESFTLSERSLKNRFPWIMLVPSQEDWPIGTFHVWFNLFWTTINIYMISSLFHLLHVIFIYVPFTDLQ